MIDQNKIIINVIRAVYTNYLDINEDVRGECACGIGTDNIFVNFDIMDSDGSNLSI